MVPIKRANAGESENEEIRLVNKLGGAVFLQYAANKNKHKLNPKTQHNKAGKCLVNVL